MTFHGASFSIRNAAPLFSKNHRGFTLIEVLIFIIVTSLIAPALFIAFTTAQLNAPAAFENLIARQTAKQCMEWFIGQRRLNNYNSVSCPSTTVPSFCTAPTGYTLSVNIACTTINSDANYKTITVTVSGKSNATLTTLIANY